MPAPPGSTRRVVEFGERLFGKEWGAPLARLIGVNVRTVDRIKAAHAAGGEYPAAGGVLLALEATLLAIVADLGKAI